MPRKEVNEICVKLAGIEAKLDSLADLLTRHDGHLNDHNDRLRHVEKQLNIAFGWAGAVGFIASLIWSFVWDKIHGR